MPKRLETSKEQIFLTERVSASRDAIEILTEIQKVQESLSQYPKNSPAYNAASGRISDLRNMLQTLVQKGQAGLTYEDLAAGSPFMQNIKMDPAQFSIPQEQAIRYPDAEQLQGMSEVERQIAESEVEQARGDVTDYAEKAIAEKSREQQAIRKEKADAERAEKLLQQQEAERTRQQGEERIRRDLIDNEIWSNLSDKKNMLGYAGTPGSLTEREQTAIMRLLRSAPEDIQTDERFDEFMQDLFNVVESNRDLKNVNIKSSKVSSWEKTSVEIPKEVRSLLKEISETYGPQALSFDLRPEQERPKLGPSTRSIKAPKDPVTIGDQETEFWDGVNIIGEGENSYAEVLVGSKDGGTPEKKTIPLGQLIDFRLEKIKDDVERIAPSLQGRTSLPEFEWGGISEDAIGRELYKSLIDSIKEMVGSKYPEVRLSPEAEMVATPGPEDEIGRQRQTVTPMFAEDWLNRKERKQRGEETRSGDPYAEEIEELARRAPELKRILEKQFGPIKPAKQKTVRDEQNIEEDRYRAYVKVGEDLDYTMSNVEDRVEEGYGDLPFGTSTAYPEGYPIEKLHRIPGHQFIRLWMQTAHGIKDPSQLNQSHMPTNREALEILQFAQDSIAMNEFLEEGGIGEGIQRKESSRMMESALAAAFRRNGYNAKKIDAKGAQREAIKDLSDTVSQVSQLDPLYSADFQAWLDIVGTEKASEMGIDLSDNQRQNAKTWYTYDWWIENVFYGEQKTATERIKFLKANPEAANKEAEGRYEQKLEDRAKKRIPGELSDFGILDYDNVKEYIDATYPELSDGAKRTQFKMMKRQVLLDKIASFMKYDPDISEFLKTANLSWRDAMGQYERAPIGVATGKNLPDVANIVFAYIAMQFVRNNSAGLPYVENLLNSTQDKPEMLRQYIRSIARKAVLSEMRKQEATQAALRTQKLDEEIGKAAEFLSSPYADDDPESTQATQYLRDTFSDDPENVQSADELVFEMIGNPILLGQSGLDAILRKLPGDNKTLWAFLYGEGGPRDIWSDSGKEQGRKLRLAQAVAEWENLTGERVSPDAFRKRKNTLLNLANTVVANSFANNPDLVELVKMLRGLGRESADAQASIQEKMKRIEQADLPQESGFEDFIEETTGGEVERRQQAPIDVNEPSEADQLERVEKIRRKSPRREF